MFVGHDRPTLGRDDRRQGGRQAPALRLGLYRPSSAATGKRLLTACSDRQARVWDVDTGKPIVTTPAQSDEVYAACFTADEALFLIGTRDGRVECVGCDARQHGSLPVRRLPGMVYQLVLSGDGARVLAAGRLDPMHGFDLGAWIRPPDDRLSRADQRLLAEIPVVASASTKAGRRPVFRTINGWSLWQQLRAAHPDHPLLGFPKRPSHPISVSHHAKKSRNDRRLIAWETRRANRHADRAGGHRTRLDGRVQRPIRLSLPAAGAGQPSRRWIVRNPAPICLRWNGGPLASDLRIRLLPGAHRQTRVTSHFGHGIVTFGIPYLMRTPPGINLWVKGPANWIKDGIQPLEGLVETDWSESNLYHELEADAARNHTVQFDQGEPMCM